MTEFVHLRRLTAAVLVLGSVITGWLVATPSDATPSTTTTSVLSAGQTLHSGQKLTSASGAYSAFADLGQLILTRTFGALRVRDVAGSVRPGQLDNELAMQTDGNFVLYSNGRAVWSTNTAGLGANNRVVMQDDGNIVLYQGDVALWASGLPIPNLGVGGVLRASQSLYGFARDPLLSMQTDGNLVSYGFNNYPLWTTNTRVPGSVLILQTDCNLVIYTRSGVAVWSSRTAGAGNGCRLTVQDDGNIVIYTEQNRAVWSTRTAGRL